MKYFFAEKAWIGGQWQQNVRLGVGTGGFWESIATDEHAEPADERVSVILPGLTDAHSHAFQRAMAGIAEQGSADGDNFWRWRQAMYQVALRITPEQLQVIAAWLYAELLSHGYTQVCEFHYVHRDVEGNHFSDPAQMSWALVQAAQETGIGLTLLPTLYQHRGFGHEGLEHHQRRFQSTPDFIHDVRQQVNGYAKARHATSVITAGVAIHSLRAVHAAGITELLQGCGQHPIHIHVAEQQQEVQDSQFHTGLRPIEWLLEHVDLDSRWNLVHATHTVPAELIGVARSDASVVICPVTEANLGDGIFDLTTAIDAGLRCSIGTDSHTNRDWAAELRSLEYSLRLSRRQRNVASRAINHYRATGSVLFEMALAGGTNAAGVSLGGIALGQRADFFEIETEMGALAGLSATNWIDATIFSTPTHQPRRVFVAGSCQQPDLAAIRDRAVKVMRKIWLSAEP